MTANTVPLVIDHLSFRYRTRSDLALQDVSFDLHAGQVLLIAGASGCGKTTLIRCINGLIPRSYKGGELTGRILINGKDPSSLSLAQISQTVGTVLQDPDKQIVGSYVFNEVAFGLENLGVPRPELIRRVEDILDYLAIGHLAHNETFRLSGGEKQKVTLAGVLVMRPSILLLDEPLAQLDPQSAQEALALIRRLADEGLAVIVIEHRVEDLLGIHPEHALFLSNGAVRYFGDIEGFKKVADYREVKLPAPLIMEQVAREAGRQVDRETGKQVDKGTRRQGDKEMEDEGSSFVPSTSSEKARDPSSRRASRPSPLAPPLVQFKHVSFAYDPERPVLHDVNLEIRPGDVIALLGPNGAGKSTLIKHAIGLLKPSAGQVLVNGEDTHKKSSAQLARTLGYVFQSPTQMLFAPTVREELSFGPRNLGFKAEEISNGVKLSVQMLNLEGLEDFSPFSLSYGQQKRVSIAAIMAMESRILVMDEPTAGQDYRNYTGFMDSILALTNFEAIIFITHDLDLAIMHANRVWLLSGGHIVADGALGDILPDKELLRKCRIVPTSLLDENLHYFPQTRQFMSAERLALVAGIRPQVAGNNQTV